MSTLNQHLNNSINFVKVKEIELGFQPKDQLSEMEETSISSTITK